MFQRVRKSIVVVLGILLCLYTLIAVNYNLFQPQSRVAIFVLLGIVLCFLTFPVSERFKDIRWLSFVDVALALMAIVCFAYIFIQTEPLFQSFWPSDGEFTKPTSLGNRAGSETRLDLWIGLTGLLLVLEATRRSIGWIVPALALCFVLHSYYCHISIEHNLAEMPDWMLPHQGQNLENIASSTFLQSLGVLGTAANVMFKYVFLFVVFGAFLEMSGATKFIIDFAERVFARSPGGPAKVAVLGSGLMGSLSGSAVANAVTTGSFTIPMMRNSGFKRHVAGGITAAAAAGGALVPPVMGAGAYMMLEFVERGPGEPQITFLEIARAAVIPAILYYLSIFMIVHFYARRIGTVEQPRRAAPQKISPFEGGVFFGALLSLVGLLILGFSPFKAVTGALVFILFLATLHKKLELTPVARRAAILTFFAITLLHQLTILIASHVPAGLANFVASSWRHPDTHQYAFRLIFDSLFSSTIAGMFGLIVFGLVHRKWRPEMVTSLTKSAKNGIALVAASACVGIIIGIVQTTPMANEFSAAIKSVVESNLLLALIGIMVCSLIMGMGVPSVVCYLLIAALMGSLLGEMGVDPLAAHLFIFYFGMMSMVTPPVALAAYASASIASAKIMPTAFAAFRFSLVGFTLPFMFIYRPSLLLMGKDGRLISWSELPVLLIALTAAIAGIVSLSIGVTGYFKTTLKPIPRGLTIVAAGLLLLPEVGGETTGWIVNLVGGAIFLTVAAINYFQAGNGKVTS